MPSLHDPSSPAYRKARRLHHKATKNRDPALERHWSPFRAAEKKYKARFPPPDLSDVLDLATLDPARDDEIRQGIWRGSGALQHRELQALGRPARFYTIPQIPGLVILPSFVSKEQQRELIRWALRDQARHNETNLDIHYSQPPQGLWDAWIEARRDSGEDIVVQPKATRDSAPEQEPPGPRRLVNNTPATPDNFSAISTTPKPPPAPSATIKQAHVSELLFRLRWANIGWFYHWGTKQYDFTKGKGAIDPSLRDLCRDAVAAVDWKQVYSGDWADWTTWNESYEPDAGIVNFYQTKDTLMAHVDRSEVCATSPLVSISLGNAAIFLIGGLTRDSTPVPILLRSGDVVIMSGPECRRAYHGVPRILDNTLPPHLEKLDKDWEPYEAYLRTTRINVNVRQGILVDLYVPRKCSATNRLITSKDHASVQISIIDVDANGVALNTSTSFALCGQVRSQGESDDSINRLATKAGLTAAAAGMDDEYFEASSSLDSLFSITSLDSMVEIKRTDPAHIPSTNPDDNRYRLIYSKSKVYVNPTAYARDNIPGFIALVKREAANPTYLLAWIPETLLNERGTTEWDKFVKIEEKVVWDEKDDDVVLIELPIQRPESYAFSVPLTSIYSLLVRPPTLSSWYGSIGINLINGDTLPTLHFHDDESRSFSMASTPRPLVQDTTSYPPPAPHIPQSVNSWGGEDLLSRMRSYCHVMRSTLDPLLFLIDPSRADIDAHSTQIFSDDAVDDILAQSSFANSHSPVPAHRRPRPITASPPNPYSHRSSILHRSLSSPPSNPLPSSQARLALLQSFSNITRATRHAAQNILSHPLAKPIVPHLPDPVRSLVNASGEWQWGSWVEKGGVGEFESARVYLARWARIVAEEGERARRREAQTLPSTSVAQETSSLGIFELLHSTVNLPTPKSSRDPGHPVDEIMWSRWFAEDGRPKVGIEEMRREVFRRGVSAKGKLRQTIWPFILGVYEWDATRPERLRKWEKKRYVSSTSEEVDSKRLKSVSDDTL
ncbi:hypothetical protein C0993_011551 [Termitomyces sp. T159_Od127]|nr:hypothetical protein C0993_011551 [Termitomyces sp. T159_Od127]